MSNLPIELILVVVLVASGAVIHLLRRVRAKQTRSQLDACDYVIFEALPLHLSNIQADLSRFKWQLAGSEPTDSGAVLYRFEKIDVDSASLSEIFEFERSMPRTANRTTGGLIKIAAHGSSRVANAQAR